MATMSKRRFKIPKGYRRVRLGEKMPEGCLIEGIGATEKEQWIKCHYTLNERFPACWRACIRKK